MFLANLLIVSSVSLERHWSHLGVLCISAWVIALWLTPYYPCMTFDPSNVSYILVRGYSYTKFVGRLILTSG